MSYIFFINLVVPISNVLYINYLPHYLKILTGKSLIHLKKIIYCKSYISINFNSKRSFLTGGLALKKLLQYKSFLQSGLDLNTKVKIIFNYFKQTKSNPTWLMFRYLPVIPPSVRPIVKLEDKLLITTDINFLYKNIININNKIKKLYIMSVPNLFLNNEILVLQTKVDQLVITSQNKKLSSKPLKSLTDNLRGKKGRLRENILGKTVDYSGRSVIAVGPDLYLNQCSLPVEIAFELFYPFLVQKLLKLKIVNSLKNGIKKLKDNCILSSKILSLVTKNHIILLNRAPSLHRLSIQAFFPLLNTKKIIQLHPLVCSAFNADFDGDQMGIHIPLSLKSRSEAQTMLISSNNFTLIASGSPNILPSQDIVLGCYFLTTENCCLTQMLKKIKYFCSKKLVLLNYKQNKLKIDDYIWLFLQNKSKSISLTRNQYKLKPLNFVRTTVGRILFNNIIEELL